MPTVIATIQGHDVTLQNNGSVTFTAKAAIDADGSGPSLGDPDFQHDTSLHHDGSALNANVVRYIVVPPAIIRGVVPIVLGSQARVTYQGKTVDAVVGDVGPRRNLGEISVACARALGIPESPTTGGVSGGVDYVLFPGVPAIVDGITYNLQRS